MNDSFFLTLMRRKKEVGNEQPEGEREREIERETETETKRKRERESTKGTIKSARLKQLDTGFDLEKVGAHKVRAYPWKKTKKEGATSLHGLANNLPLN